MVWVAEWITTVWDMLELVIWVPDWKSKRTLLRDLDPEWLPNKRKPKVSLKDLKRLQKVIL